jgi:hypothetical protein
MIVIVPPRIDGLARLGKREEHALVEALVAKLAVERFHEGVLHWLAGFDVVPLESAGGPAQHCAAGDRSRSRLSVRIPSLHHPVLQFSDISENRPKCPNKPPGGHHGTDVPTREELDRMLCEAGFEVVLSRVSLGRMKAVAQRPARLVAPDAA